MNSEQLWKNSEIIYVYDLSFEGLLTCVFEAFSKKEMPFDITDNPDTMFEVREIKTDTQKAARVKKGIYRDLGDDFTYVIRMCYISREQSIGIDILKLIRMGYDKGAAVIKNLNDPLINKMVKLSRNVGMERIRFIEFSRFSEFNGALVSVINPKYFVLPLIAGHFTDRFPNESFLIYDEVHNAALIYINRKSVIVPMEEFIMPEPDENEKRIRELWQMFYDTIEIKERRNHDLRRQHFPKRFWKNVTEFSKEVKN